MISEKNNIQFNFYLIKEIYQIQKSHAKYLTMKTAAVAQWLERSPRWREVGGSIPDRVIPKTL